MANESRVRDALAELAAGVQALSEWVAAHPDTAEAGSYYGTRWLLGCLSADEYRDMVRDVIAGAPIGAVKKTASDDFQNVERDFGGGVVVEVFVARGQVCERVVVGTETVEVPDPDAPMVTVERDVVEWKCSPILAGPA